MLELLACKAHLLYGGCVCVQVKVNSITDAVGVWGHGSLLLILPHKPLCEFQGVLPRPSTAPIVSNTKCGNAVAHPYFYIVSTGLVSLHCLPGNKAIICDLYRWIFARKLSFFLLVAELDYVANFDSIVNLSWTSREIINGVVQINAGIIRKKADVITHRVTLSLVTSEISFSLISFPELPSVHFVKQRN